MGKVSIAEIGQKEIKGAEHNSRIIEYHATTGGFKNDETPWCASYVNWVIKESYTVSALQPSSKNSVEIQTTATQQDLAHKTIFIRQIQNNDSTYNADILRIDAGKRIDNIADTVNLPWSRQYNQSN